MRPGEEVGRGQGRGGRPGLTTVVQGRSGNVMMSAAPTIYSTSGSGETLFLFHQTMVGGSSCALTDLNAADEPPFSFLWSS